MYTRLYMYMAEGIYTNAAFLQLHYYRFFKNSTNNKNTDCIASAIYKIKVFLGGKNPRKTFYINYQNDNLDLIKYSGEDDF